MQRTLKNIKWQNNFGLTVLGNFSLFLNILYAREKHMLPE